MCKAKAALLKQVTFPSFVQACIVLSKHFPTVKNNTFGDHYECIVLSATTIQKIFRGCAIRTKYYGKHLHCLIRICPTKSASQTQAPGAH